MKLHPVVLLHKFSGFLLAVLKPLGIWGVGALSLIDSALIPIPVSMDGVLIGYVATDHSRFLAYSLIAAVASAIGSLVPYYIGRAGGELVLLKRVNRERYERIRDRFEKQEFLAIMIPAMLPPPTPMKLFEFAAGVFEMKPVTYVLAVFTGKLIQFLVCSLLTIWFGPTLVHTLKAGFHEHMGLTIGGICAVLFLIVFWVVRKTFDKKRGAESLPIED
ncbi:YqaA family protein [Granulicella cerasi]|uniref:YqaA family protein n=1 Tax=Granulicella cerasi TaxID=741063 RepID=A0ABW1ZET6_9BACT|nr:VTT domain-containing protein [Granulicella cerasi]